MSRPFRSSQYVSVNPSTDICAQVTSHPVAPSSSPEGSRPDSPIPAGYELITTYNQQGFPEVATVPVGWASAPKHYNDQGFLITAASPLDSRSSPTAAADDPASTPSVAVQAVAETASTAPSVSKVAAPNANSASNLQGYGVVLSASLAIIFGGALIWT